MSEEQKQKVEEGVPQENQSPEEIQAQLEQAKKEKEELEKRLQGLEDKSINFKRMREASKNKEREVQEKERTLEERQRELEEQQQSFLAQQKQQQRDLLIREFVGNDKEAKEKVVKAFEQDLAAVADSSEEELREKIKKACNLSGVGKIGDMSKLSGAVSYQGMSYRSAPTPASGSLDPEIESLGREMGVGNIIDSYKKRLSN